MIYDGSLKISQHENNVRFVTVGLNTQTSIPTKPALQSEPALTSENITYYVMALAGEFVNLIKLLLIQMHINLPKAYNV